MARAVSLWNSKSVISQCQFSIQEIVFSTIQCLGITLSFFAYSSGLNNTDKFQPNRLVN